tara:strand:- start:11 stop:670 length:660 start_codon:yes stop_codon:yes gene_type:complete
MGAGTVTGDNNTCVGEGAGSNITDGADNVFIGTGAGGHDVNFTTGDHCVVIGSIADVSAAGAQNQNVLGYNVTSAGNDSFTFGSGTDDTTCTNGGTTWSAPSDIRLKEDIQDEVVGMDFINELRPVTFRWKKAKDIPEDLVSYSEDSEKRVMNGKYNHGFIAQEVKQAIDNQPEIKDGFDMWREDDIDGRQRVGESALIPILVKAVQELSAKVEALENA